MKRYKIFLVDDDEMILALLQSALYEFDHCEVEVFTSGEACIDMIPVHQPDLVVLDYHLDTYFASRKNGFEILTTIKSQYPGVNVVMLSGQTDDPEMVFKAIKNGAADYIIKDQEGLTNLKSLISEEFGAIAV